MSDVANVLSDTLAQGQATITRAQVTDVENAIPLLVPAAQAGNVHVDVYDYYMNGATLTQRWHTSSAKGTACTAPSTSNDASLIATGSDLIVAVSCMTYSPWVGTFMGGPYILGSSTFTITQNSSSTPYASLIISCVTTSGGTTPCNG